MRIDEWIYCPKGEGYLHENVAQRYASANAVPRVSTRLHSFKKNSVGRLKNIAGDKATVWLIGTDQVWDVQLQDIRELDVRDTGDKKSHKICNLCHCLLPVNEFDPNQTNKHGVIRRPSCKQCRTDIDKRAPKSSQAKQMEKDRPKIGEPFTCPICQKRSIAGVTAKIVADHNHHTGDIRDFICESCNTGLGRFKNGSDCLRNALHYIEDREPKSN